MPKEEQLEDIYRKRKQDCLWCIEQGYTFEQMNEYVAHYQDEIDELIPLKKNGKGYEIGKPHAVFRILGLFGSATNVDDKSLVKGEKVILKNGKHYTGPAINSEPKYARLLIKRIGWEIYLGDDEDDKMIFDVILDNCNEDDYNWWLSISMNDQI